MYREVNGPSIEGEGMLFNSYVFIFLFLPLVLAGYYGLNSIKKHKLALCWLIVLSLLFYGYDYQPVSMRYLALLVVSILLNFLLVEMMSRTAKNKWRRVCLIMGLLLNLGILFYCKYYDFFIENINAIFGTDIGFLRIVLPLGISFYTFQQLSYVIDSYKRDCEKYSLVEYAAYVSFFPQLIAGPIVYHDELIPQLRDMNKKRINAVCFSKGIYAFSLGLAKKVLVADTFSKVVTIGYQSIGDLNTPSALLVMVCYSMQIYFDFSGYCDMAYGIGYLFNIELPVNFNSPYKADSIVSFWDRWHMTLTRFFTKYVYIPLGGSRRGTGRTYLNILVVFFVSGVWHGANWTFILWGMMNGVANVLNKIFDKLYKKVPKILRIGMTFLFSTFAWSLFRAESIKQAKQLWDRLFHGGFGAIYAPITDQFQDMIEMKILYRAGFGSLIETQPWFFVVLFTVVAVMASFTMRNTQEKVATMRYTNRKIAVITFLVVWSVMSLSEVSEFLYFNF